MTIAAIDPSWAIPLNTALLIVLAIVNVWRSRITKKRIDLVSQQAADAKNKCGATRRDEDRQFIEQVKESLPDEAAPRRRFGKRFYDGSK